MRQYVTVIGMSLLINLVMMPFVQAEDTKQNELVEEAKAALLLDRDTGTILYEKNAEEELPPASMTKIMTLLLIMEALESESLTLEEEITISESAASMGGSQVFLEAGEVMSVEDLVKAIAIASGNDASVALAERIAGTEKEFVKQMNDKVEELGLNHTKFANASGLPAKEHYTTAHDMAMIAKELLKYEKIVNYTSIYEDYLRKGEENEFWLVNTNKLVHFSPYIDGLKTGYTSKAKYGLTATAKKDDMRVVSVVMGADNTEDRNEMTMKLIDYAFQQFESEKVYDKGDKVAELELQQAEDQVYDVVTSEQISLLQDKQQTDEKPLQTDVHLYDEDISLPIEKGDTIGELVISQDGEVIQQSDLHVAKQVNYANYFTLWKRSIGFITKHTDI